jgi:hypothetical protein
MDTDAQTPQKRSGPSGVRRVLDDAHPWRIACPHGHVNLDPRVDGAYCATCQRAYDREQLVDKRTGRPPTPHPQRRAAGVTDGCAFCTADAVAAGTAENPLSGDPTAEIAVCATHLTTLASADTDSCALDCAGDPDHTLPASVFGGVEIDGEEQYVGRFGLCRDCFDGVAVDGRAD